MNKKQNIYIFVLGLRLRTINFCQHGFGLSINWRSFFFLFYAGLVVQLSHSHREKKRRNTSLYYCYVLQMLTSVKINFKAFSTTWQMLPSWSTMNIQFASIQLKCLRINFYCLIVIQIWWWTGRGLATLINERNWFGCRWFKFAY